MLNIPSTVVDPTYRYIMPKMQLKIQSKGNGIKTNIVNLQDVAKHLRTDESYILKFFGFEKASQTIEKASENKSNKQGKANTNTSYIIQGSFSDDELLKVLDKFIQKYILCPKCKLPEMNMYVVNQKIHGKCDSCPFNGEIDNKHKITSTILKKPPVARSQAIKATKVIEQKIEEKKEAKEISKDEKAQAKKQEKQQMEQASKLFSAENLQFGSPELEKLIEYSRKYMESKKNEDFDIASAQAVQNFKPLGLKKTLFAYVIFNALFTVNIAKQAQQNAPMYKKLMKRLVSNSDENNELQTLLNLQYLFFEVNKEKDFSKFIPTILHKLHENEILSKQFLVKWFNNEIKDIDKFFLFNNQRNQKLRQLSTEFVNYLNDDSESDEQTK